MLCVQLVIVTVLCACDCSSFARCAHWILAAQGFAGNQAEGRNTSGHSGVLTWLRLGHAMFIRREGDSYGSRSCKGELTRQSLSPRRPRQSFAELRRGDIEKRSAELEKLRQSARGSLAPRSRAASSAVARCRAALFCKQQSRARLRILEKLKKEREAGSTYWAHTQVTRNQDTLPLSGLNGDTCVGSLTGFSAPGNAIWILDKDTKRRTSSKLPSLAKCMLQVLSSNSSKVDSMLHRG